MLLTTISSCKSHVHIYKDGICNCGDYDNKWLDENFYLDDVKSLFNGNENEDFECDVILVTLKKSKTYIELSLNHFNNSKITYMEYLSGPRPPEYFFKDEYKDMLEKYRQIISLHVDNLNKSEIIELGKELEKLEFVKSVSVNYINTGA